jgi:hypothetical protein
MKTLFVGIGDAINDTTLWNAIARKYPKITGEISHEAALRCGKKCNGKECANSSYAEDAPLCTEGQLWESIENPTPEQVKGNRVIGNLPVDLAALAAEYYQLSGEGDSLRLIRFVVMTFTNWCRSTGMVPSLTWEWPQDD